MILFIFTFIEKTWFLWWMLAIVVALRWFHLVSAGIKMEDPDALTLEEEEAYIISWWILHKAQAISLSGTERAY